MQLVLAVHTPHLYAVEVEDGRALGLQADDLHRYVRHGLYLYLLSMQSLCKKVYHSFPCNFYLARPFGVSKAQIRQTLPLGVSALDQSSHLPPPPLINVYGVRFGAVVRRPRIDGGTAVLAQELTTALVVAPRCIIFKF
jgi:hypothetical protein